MSASVDAVRNLPAVSLLLPSSSPEPCPLAAVSEHRSRLTLTALHPNMKAACLYKDGLYLSWFFPLAKGLWINNCQTISSAVKTELCNNMISKLQYVSQRRTEQLLNCSKFKRYPTEVFCHDCSASQSPGQGWLHKLDD